MPASPPSREQASPPLRSTTVLRSPGGHYASSFSGTTKASVDSIRLNTYHDSSDLKAALRELEAAFAGSAAAAEPSDAATTSTSAAATAAGQFPPSAFSGRRSPRDEYLPQSDPLPTKAASASPTITIIRHTAGSKAAAAATPPPPPPARSVKKKPSLFVQLPSQLLLHCFSFCPLKTLGTLCCVSVRFNVLVTQQGTALWTAAALRCSVPITNASAPRDDLRMALAERARARNAEEDYYEAEIKRMEERLRVRAADVYAQNIDVERTIASGGDCIAGRRSDGAAAASTSPEPYWMHQQRQAARDGGGNADEGGSPNAQLCTKLRSEIAALEEAKRRCESRLALQEGSVREQEEQLRLWQELLCPGLALVSAPDGKPEPAQPQSTPHVSAAQLDQFERRVSRLVLCGATPAASETKEGDAVPVILRRGVDSFASLELVLRALHTPPCAASAASTTITPAGSEARGPGPAVNPAPDHSNSSSTSSVATKEREAETPADRDCPSPAVWECAKRWRAFQQVFPINEEYANVRHYLRSQQLRAVTHDASGKFLSVSDSVGRPSSKQTPALLRVFGFIRRIEAMSDSQVVQAWM